MESRTSTKKIRDLLPGEEIVISGISGRYPETNDVNQFRDHLFNKVDMITEDARRWQHSMPEIPKRGGRLMNITEFDAGNFGVYHKFVNSMDPMMKMLMENTYEAVLDAGYQPSDFKGTNTGVFIGACMSESEQISLFEKVLPRGHAILNNVRSMLTDQIAYWLQIKGPSIIADTACSSSMFAFDQAYRALLEGRCDKAIVGSSNLCLHPYISLQFARLGVLSLDGRCKTFDNAADGYARSEGNVILVLELAKTAKRVYAEVCHSKTNCDGYKEQGITYPSGKVQINLLEDFYDECGRLPTCLTYMEAHGTGTPVGDPEELYAIDQACAVGRTKPLYIGSVKSNIGHNEPVSGLCSITKVIIGFENEAIPPNMNFKEIRKGVEGLEKKRMIVVAEKMPWPDNEGLVGVNSFGFGGANSHVLLSHNKKVKVNHGIPEDNLPRLICFSARCEETLTRITDDLESRPVDGEFAALYHNIFRSRLVNHCHHGFLILAKDKGTVAKGTSFEQESPEPIALLFGNIDRKLPACLKQLMESEVFQQVFDKFKKIYSLQKLKFDPTKILNSYDENNIIHQLLGTVIVQMGTYEMLKSLNVKVDNSYGLSVGILTVSYINKFLTFEEVAIISYLTALLLNENGKTIEYNNSKDNLNKDDLSQLSKKMHDFIKQILVNKNGRELNKEEVGLVDYLVKNLLNTNSSDLKLPRNHFILECGTCKLSSNDLECLKIINPDSDVIENLLKNLGKLYLLGYEVDVRKIYPKVSFPVSRGTPMIGPLVKLNHSKNWQQIESNAHKLAIRGHRKLIIGPQAKEWRFIVGHVIDGRNLFPATGYLFAVWQIFAASKGKAPNKMNITFEDVKFLRAVHIPKNGQIEMDITVFKNTGKFELMESNSVIVTGKITEQVTPEEFVTLPLPDEDNSFEMNEKDIYKELRLRGYNYNGLFRSLKKCNINATKGMVQWDNNWVAFLDNMLQIVILQRDNRNLYVPTGIEKLVIHASKHIELVENMGENPLIPVHVWQEAKLVRTEAIELRGMNASAINRRKPRAFPVLERYNFLPNNTSLTLNESVRASIQIMLENAASLKIKSVELVDENVDEEFTPLSPIILEVLGDMPLIQPEVLIYTPKAMEVENVTVENAQIDKETAAYLICGANLLQKSEVLESAMIGLKENGFIISRESLDFNAEDHCKDWSSFATHRTESETIVLLRKKPERSDFKVMDLSNNSKTFEWIPALQNLIKTEQPVVLYAQNDDLNGILGFINCLRREQSGDRFRCVFIKDKNAPPFDPKLDLYKKQLEKGMGINVYENQQWGTYRHLLLDEPKTVEDELCFATNLINGDLNSLKWVQIPHIDAETSNSIVHVNYAALNFRDIMTASGRLGADVITENRLRQNCLLGFEYSGTTLNGRRVMGIINAGGLATQILTDEHMTFDVPDEWTLEEAATVPVIYATVLYALVFVAKIKKADSILIHSGTGGVGQATINVATHYGCDIFVTVGTEEKREFIKKNFPQIPESHIGNSRDVSFVDMIRKETNSRGVDIVLNSLAEEKLLASVSCLAPKGRFMEIGKFDFSVNNPLTLGLLSEGQAFSGVMLDLLLKFDPHHKKSVSDLLVTGLQAGYIKPIIRTVFEKNDVIDAFRYMTSGKHIGKVLLKIKDENEKGLARAPCLPRLYCDPLKCTVILGGLGGFGLELADWLILRGCRKIVLNTRNGIVTGYQASRVRIWKSYAVNVVISKDDATTKSGCESLLKLANELGPVENIFNVAVVLRDKMFDNQTPEDYQTSLAGKAYATEHLDELSRAMCPDLRHFVVFSSVSCGRGNSGQTNYGMANSIMERICEKRKQDGKPALVVQWGAVGDVGLVAEMFETAIELSIAGTLQQSITSCLSLLDHFLFQEQTIVASMVVAEKRIGSGEMGIIETVASILGIRDIKTVSPHITLPELGMDSMMGVEVKQTLEREYDIFLAAQDIRTMTFAKLKQLIEERESGQKKSEANTENASIFFRFIEDEAIASKNIIKLHEDEPDNAELENVYLLPGVEGMFSSMKPLANKLKANVYCLQYGYGQPEDSIEEVVERVLKTAVENIDKSKPFTIIAHSYGAVLVTELIWNLEQLGYRGKLFVIDGSWSMMKQMTTKQLQTEDEVQIQMAVLVGLMSQVLPIGDVLKHKEELEKCKTYEERVWFIIDRSTAKTPHSKEYQAQLCMSLYKRINAVAKYEYIHSKLVTPTTLYKPSISTYTEAEEDLGWSAMCENPVIVKCFDGNHVTILNNELLAEEINSELGWTERKVVLEETNKGVDKVEIERISAKSEAVKP